MSTEEDLNLKTQFAWEIRKRGQSSFYLYPDLKQALKLQPRDIWSLTTVVWRGGVVRLTKTNHINKYVSKMISQTAYSISW